MKKKLFLLLIGLSLSALKAQETIPEDAIKYAVENITGSARFRGMSGAFGALGGDLSAISVNPAGSIFFNNNYATFTASSYNSKNASSYFGTNTNDNDNSFDVNQAGAVFVFRDDSNAKNDWKKFSIALNYENTNNFNNSIFSAGVNPTNSIDSYFLRFANGLPNEGGITLNSLINGDFGQMNFIDQQAYLGYQAYIFNPLVDSPQNTLYVSNVPTNKNYYQDFYNSTTGYNGKGSINFSSIYKDKLAIGVNFNFHYTDITKTNSVYEAYNTDPTTGLQSVQFDTNTHTFGHGFSINLGAIYKFTDSFRFGLAYESPTWYRLEDEQSQRTIAYCPDCDPNHNPAIFDPQLIMVYRPYNVQTPGKWTGSLAYIFGKRGLLSADISTKNYSSTRFKPKNDYSDINKYMSANLVTNALEVRIGGEYRIKQFSIRGGYRFEESPYKIDRSFGDLTGYSSGIGYNFGEFKLDLSYSYEHRKMDQLFLSSGMTDAARISRYNNNITLSYSMNF